MIPKPLQVNHSSRSRSAFKRFDQVAAFTLVEMLAAVAVLALIMIILTQSFTTISKSWNSTTGRGSVFASARAGFEALKLNLSQATLNTYLAYATSNGTPVPLLNPSFAGAQAASFRQLVPTQYARSSELHFISGPANLIFNQPDVSNTTLTSGHAVFFQAPIGFVNTPQNRSLSSLLNVFGYYVAFNSSADFVPADFTSTGPPQPNQPHLPARWRYRLMEVVQPTEFNSIYGSTCKTTSSTGSLLPDSSYDLNWIGSLKFDPITGKVSSRSSSNSPFSTKYEHILAENIILLALLPKLPDTEMVAGNPVLTAYYDYDSRAWAKGLANSKPYPFASLPNAGTVDPRWRNQLPPLMELVVVAIDEPSAQRLSQQYGGPNGDQPPFANNTVIGKAGINLATDVFQQYVPPQNNGDESSVDTDIRKIETGLTNLGVSYRIFRTNVALSNSQWSSN